MAQELEQADVTAASIGAPGWLQRLNSARGAALLTLLAYGLAFVARLVSLGGDISRFTLASDKFIPAASARAVGLSVLTRGYGYDGQFYYLLALNPLAAHPALAGAHFGAGQIPGSWMGLLRPRAELEGRSQQGGRIDVGVAMDLAVAQKLGLLETGDQA